MSEALHFDLGGHRRRFLPGGAGSIGERTANRL